MKLLPDSNRLRIVPMLFVMGTIFFLSHQPGDSLHLPAFPGIDKLAHLTICCLLGLTVFHALPVSWIRNHSKILVYLTVITTVVAYGISDEFHQSFIPGRQTSGADLVADGFGGIVAIFIWSLRNSRLPHLKKY